MASAMLVKRPCVTWINIDSRSFSWDLVGHLQSGFWYKNTHWRSLKVSEHGDVIKWKHFPRYWPFVRGIHRWPVNSLTKASETELWCFFDLRLNKRFSKQSGRRWFEMPSHSLWRHCNDDGENMCNLFVISVPADDLVLSFVKIHLPTLPDNWHLTRFTRYATNVAIPYTKEVNSRLAKHPLG